MQQLFDDIYAKITTGPRMSRWANAWDLPGLPLTVEFVKVVSASQKKGNYRSADQYIGRAIQEHKHLIGEIPMLVQLAIKDANRSPARGIGTTAFKDSFKVENLRSLVLTLHHNELNMSRLPCPPMPTSTTSSTCKTCQTISSCQRCTQCNMAICKACKNIDIDCQCMGHMVKANERLLAVDACVLGSWWLTRGIELAAARACHMWTDKATKTASWSLPISKTDPKDMCTTRTHGCCCRANIEPICPYHTATRHLRRLRSTFGKDFARHDLNIPLFPSCEGEFRSHFEMTGMIQDIIELTGEPLTRPGVDGRRLQRFAEHVLRVSGAQLMARGGMDLYFIQLMGRWGSNSIERYVQDSYLLDQNNVSIAVTDKINARPDTGHSTEMISENNKSSLTDATMISLQKDIETMQIELGTLRTKVDLKALILNNKTQTMHIPVICEKGTPSSTWKTRCGWAYAKQTFCRVTCLPAGASRCTKCWKTDDPIGPCDEPEHQDSSESSNEN